MDNQSFIRFKEKVEINPDTGCWEWIGYTDKGGYGRFRIGSSRNGDRNMATASRLSYEHHIGPIPDGMCVCHSCDNPACVNPDHLWLGTYQDNMDDMVAKGRWKSHGFKGEQCPRAKLTEKDVLKIRKLVKSMSNKQVAKMFGVHHSTISLIKLGKNWKHLEG